MLFVFCLIENVFGYAKNSSFERNKIITKYGKLIPKKWGENFPETKTKLDTKDLVLALTFDACGSKTDGYDSALINFLIQEKIPATLFVTARWIDKFPKEFETLSKNELFEIGNHGLNHRPCSVSGKSAYGIKGTKSAGEVFDEAELNALKIQEITNKKPKYFRSGTAHYDEVAVKIINDLGYEIVGFNVNGDYGATKNKEEIKNILLKAEPGSIIIFHMNRPEKETAEGIKETIPELKKRGVRFVKLSDYPLK